MGINDRLVRGDFREVICDTCGKDTGNMYTTSGKEEVGDYDLCLDCLIELPYTLDDDDEEEPEEEPETEGRYE